MTDENVPQPLPWIRTRYGFAAFWCLFLVIAWFVLRLVLYCAFKPSGLPASDVLRAFLSGFHRDLFVAIVQTLPLLAWFLIIPNHRFPARWKTMIWDDEEPGEQREGLDNRDKKVAMKSA